MTATIPKPVPAPTRKRSLDDILDKAEKKSTASKVSVRVLACRQPPRPEWTGSFVAPGFNPESKNYGKANKGER